MSKSNSILGAPSLPYGLYLTIKVVHVLLYYPDGKTLEIDESPKSWRGLQIDGCVCVCVCVFRLGG